MILRLKKALQCTLQLPGHMLWRKPNAILRSHPSNTMNMHHTFTQEPQERGSSAPVKPAGDSSPDFAHNPREDYPVKSSLNNHPKKSACKKKFFISLSLEIICYISMVIGMHRIRRLFLHMVAAKEKITMKLSSNIIDCILL